jgi:methionyl-tRNA synthetase
VKKLVETPMTEEKSAVAPARPAEIDAEEFARLDLRVGRIEAAELVKGADRLLRLTVDLGGERRTVFAGIRAAYEPDRIVGRHVVVVANMKPRKLRFGVSEGMVLAASGGDGLFLIGPDAGAAAGMKVS